MFIPQVPKTVLARLAMGAVASVVLLHAALSAAESPSIGFLAVESSPDAMGPHNRAAWQTASSLGRATLLLRQPDGSFADTVGGVRSLSEFDVVWYHQGDAIRRTAVYSGASLNEIRRFAESGRGVLLSGGALAMVAHLGLETDIRAQRHELDNHRDPAGMVPVERAHPAFSGLAAAADDDGVVWLGRRGCRAVADFYWGGPARGMVLARTPDGPENPLAEYVLGKGRVLVLGWRLPDYADAENPHRTNLLRLTSNLLNYLADANSWQAVTVRSDYPPVASAGRPGISAARWRALRLAIEDLSARFPERYPHGTDYLKRLEALRANHDRLLSDGERAALGAIAQRFDSLKNEALLANPLLDFDRLLMIRRRADRLGLPLNFHGNTDIPPTGYGNTLITLSPVRPDGTVQTVYRPEGDRFIGDVDLHFTADRLLMSMPDASGRWGIAELDLKTARAAPLRLIDDSDVHNYDACYLPDGGIVFTSTAPFIGVPCVGGRSKVANLYLRGPDGRIRRLTNDQDHNWCPTLLGNGRLLYQRWEYADIAHTFTRLLFHANPDGTQQMEYYGSNSFWPTAIFFARGVPNHPSKVVAVIGGHHDAPRQGELVVFDPALGRREADGAVQRIPGFGKPVVPVVLDGLIAASWPRFLHPYPLSEKYFLVSCKPTESSHWGVYLVDVFDNFVLLHQEPGQAMLEPIPLRPTPPPPVVPTMVDPGCKDATVLMMDVYRGPGLAGVPRGSVKSLRLVGYEFTFHGMGGEPDRVGLDGPWDVKRILGTVPVEADGSAHFRVPAATPIAVQPLDADGKALALMRSWFTAMPGEVVSCVGCHESQNTAPPNHSAPLAVRREASAIEPFYGPPRGFSFAREVQPVLDAYCVDCHNGQASQAGPATFDLSARPTQRVASAFQMHFSPSYMALRRFVHTSTLESDAHLLPPRAFHADTSKLVQILRDGHYGVRLDAEAWARLITWIDLNAPAHGSWREVVAHVPDKAALVAPGAARRRELNRRYAGFDEDPEAVHPPAALERMSATPLEYQGHGVPKVKGPLEPPRRATRLETERVEFADGVRLELVHIPSGRFIMGSDRGYPNERPTHSVGIDRAFWIGRFEITNRQFACFDARHDSGLETGEAYQFGDYERGHPLRRPEQPVVRVSWDRAMAFCRWLSETTGRPFSLPTEAQWEYAARAGSLGPTSYGSLDDDFSRRANLSDATHHTVDYPHVPTALPPWRPADTRFDDRWRVSAPVGSFESNAFGLFDAHGNVSEWTRSTYRPYPYRADDGRNDIDAAAGRSVRKVVRGGSWLDRPRRARSAFRLHYVPSQAVHDVGFRVVCEDDHLTIQGGISWKPTTSPKNNGS